MSNIIDFLTKHDIMWFPIILEFDDTPIDDPYIEGLKKKSKNIKPIKHDLYKHKKQDKQGKYYDSFKPQYDDFWNFDKEFIKARQDLYFNDNCDIEFNAVWIDTREYPQVDLDCPIENIEDTQLKDYINSFIQNAPFYNSMTKPYGKHFFFKLDENDKPQLSSLLYKFKNSDGTKNTDIDFLCGQSSYAFIDINVNNYNQTIELWDNEFHTKEFIYNDKTKQKNKSQSNTQDNTQEFKKVEIRSDLYNKFWEYFNLIDSSVLDNYDGWFLASCIHKNIVGEADYERFDNYCKQFDNYNEEINKHKYDNIQEPKAGWKKLYQLAYNCNPQGKKVIDEKFKEPAFSISKFINIKSNKQIDQEIENQYENIDDFNKEKQKKIKEAYKNELIEVKNDLYKKRKYYFEKYHAKILDPFCFIRVYENNVSVYKKQAFNDAYENLPDDFINLWRKDIWIKTYEKIDFLPPPLKVKDDVYNTFRGFRINNLIVEPNNEYSIILEQINLLTGKDQLGYDYMIKYLAHLVQRPGELPSVLLLFRSIQQGVGKNLFFEKFSETIMGRDYYVNTADIDKIIGRFSVINKKFMICLDEAHGKDTFSNNDKIKNIITAEKVTLETKGIDAFDIRNVGRYIVFSNNTNPMPIDASDRRIVAFECDCSRVGDVAYFNKLAAALDNDNIMKAFYEYLMNIDIDGWRPHVDRPKTEFYKSLKQMNMGVDKKFMKYWYDNNKTDECIQIKASDLYDEFVEYCENEEKIPQNKILKQTKFSMTITTQFNGCIEKKKSSCIKFIIEMNKLKEMLTKLDFDFDEDEEQDEEQDEE